MEKIRVPFNHSYWVKPGLFLAGQYPRTVDEKSSRIKLNLLLDTGIRHFINLTFTGEGRSHGELQGYSHILENLAHGRGVTCTIEQTSIIDMELPTHVQMKGILDSIDTSVEKNIPVYVHCWGGYGRTGTVVGCWLIRHGLADGPSVVSAIEGLRSGIQGSLYDSPQTEEQKNFIRTWSE